MGSRICIRAVNENAKIPHANTVPSKIDNILAPLGFVDDEVIQVEVRV